MEVMWSWCTCRDRQDVKPLASVLAVGEDIIEELEEVDPFARATANVDQDVPIVGRLDQRRVAVPDIDERNFECRHAFVSFSARSPGWSS